MEQGITDLAILATVPGATIIAGVLTELVKRLSPDGWGDGRWWQRWSIIFGIAVTVFGLAVATDLGVVEIAGFGVINGGIAGLAASKSYEKIGRDLDG